jgi:Cysteine-rich secretory protein family
MKATIIGFGIALAVSAALANASSAADCSTLYALAQQHAYDMARRNSLDHAGFFKHRGPAGAVAENVAVGCRDEACARRAWMKSPHHRANMALGGCQAIASAVSKNGRRYWAMEIGGGGGINGARDPSIEGGNVP